MLGMSANFAQPPIAEQPWFRELLQAHGFERTGAGAYSNGRASIRIEGNSLTALPGDGGKPWKSNFAGAPTEGIRTLLTTFLAAPSFLSQSALDQQAERQRVTEAALATIAETIRLHTETHSGIRLRQFVWSIFNQHHSVNLWRLKDVLDSRHNAAVTQVLQGWMAGHLSDAAIREALVASGEMERWDSIRLRAPEQKRLVDAFDSITDILCSTPPGTTVPALTRADGLLRQILDLLREARNPSEDR